MRCIIHLIFLYYSLNDDLVNQAPLYDIHPFSFLKSPSSMDLTRERLDKDVQRLEEKNKRQKEEEEKEVIIQ